MRAKKQIVKEFYPEGHSPLWTKDARVGDDCNHMCKVNMIVSDNEDNPMCEECNDDIMSHWIN